MSSSLWRIVHVGAAACVVSAVVVLSAGAVSPGAAQRSVPGRSSVGAPTPLIIVAPHTVDESATPPGPGSCGCYEPAQFQAAYDVGPLYAKNDTGTGETIVIVDSFGSTTIKNDLKTFDAGFDLPAPPSFKIITPEGSITGSNASWALETSLDVEYSHAIAPGANILLVETPVAETEGAVGFKQIVAAENYVIKNQKSLGINGGAVISQSFGATEQTFGSNFAKKIAPFRTAFTAAQAAGVTVLAASGDDGVTGCSNAADPCSLYTHRVNSWPSSDPLVTSVGGLQFSISTTTPYKETKAPVVWNGGGGAGGGGDSAAFAIPPFQSSVSGIVGKWRGTPDLSMSASVTGGAEIYDSGTGGWEPVGGTSEASPEFAGIVAIADQVAGKGLGDLGTALYAMESAGANGIVDVTSGNNSFNGVTGYNAVAGYDMASGIGTVDGANFVPELVAEVAKVG
jgi:subtilase family serine protease